MCPLSSGGRPSGHFKGNASEPEAFYARCSRLAGQNKKAPTIRPRSNRCFADFPNSPPDACSDSRGDRIHTYPNSLSRQNVFYWEFLASLTMVAAQNRPVHD